MKEDRPHLLYEPNAPDYRSSEASQTLFDKLAPEASLSTFMDVLTRVDNVLSLFNSSELDQPFTVFCPVNSAFRDGMNADMKAHLEEFLRNHIVPSGKMEPGKLQHTQQLETMLNGEVIQVKHHFFTQKTVLNDYAIVDTNHPIEAINGIAYKIDHVLRPPKSLT
ncbi:hypothetical protein DFQ28_003845 [Apophysomyces sp. BC1034]|nr:hypothetical protein DFQ30_002869 [Apophysomyces sp. BC1015]KAG0182179.1 hypothetical protein DFQ29_005395 [Apophysomyces sp. BC1021]KAG0193672.1 hypothetical protein DFQ28_003845 [Apophysomyces sp. BC1034]